jgi:hypothetical protein
MSEWKVKNLLQAAALTVMFAVAPRLASAQCDGGIVHARYNEGETVIRVSLSKLINAADLTGGGQAGQWDLEDLNFSPSRRVDIKNVAPDNPDNAPTFVTVTLGLFKPLNVDHNYRLRAQFLTFEGCHPKEEDTPEALLKIRKADQAGKPVDHFAKQKSKGRDDSNVYLAGQIEGARGGKPQISADIKIDQPFLLNLGAEPKAGQDPATVHRKLIRVGPYFDLKASTAEDADADSLKFGGKFEVPFNISQKNHPSLHRALTSVQWLPAGGFEADRRFHNVNTIFSNTIRFIVPGNSDTSTVRVRVFPYIGFELGRNLKSPVKEAEDRGIARGVVGTALYFDHEFAGDKSLSFQVDYVRRFLLRREVSFEEDKDKKLVPLFLGRGPRDYLKTTLEYDFDKFTGFTLSYEYGRLPPNYELVDNKYSVGLVYKFKTK